MVIHANAPMNITYASSTYLVYAGMGSFSIDFWLLMWRASIGRLVVVCLVWIRSRELVRPADCFFLFFVCLDQLDVYIGARLLVFFPFSFFKIGWKCLLITFFWMLQPLSFPCWFRIIPAKLSNNSLIELELSLFLNYLISIFPNC